MLLLDAPKKKIVNDASRATSRVADLDIKAVTPETLTDLLGLPGMRVVEFAIEEQDEQKYLHLFCEQFVPAVGKSQLVLMTVKTGVCAI